MIKKLLVAFLLLTSPVYALHEGALIPSCGKVTIDRATPFKPILKDSFLFETTSESLQRFGGLTFYKEFTEGKAAGFLPNWCVGSPYHVYTSTSGTPTLNSNGYSATTANDDVLKYAISGNRTARRETIFIKFKVTGDFANDGVERYLLNNDTSNNRRIIRKDSGGTKIKFMAISGEAACYFDSTVSILENTIYKVGYVVGTTSPYSICYIAGALDNSDNDAWNAPSWGTDFYIGTNYDGTAQLGGNIFLIAIFNRSLSASEVTAVTNLL